MESVINGYLLVLSAWMVCAVSAQLTDPAWKNPVVDIFAQRLALPFQSTVFTLAFFLIMYAIYRRVARNRRRRAGGHARPVLSAVVSMPKRDSGVERSVIDALPVFEFASLQGLKEGLECVVCLSRFEGSEVLRLLPKCRHAFHVGCVDTWLESNSTCPLCRQKIEADDVSMVYRHDDGEEAEGFDDSAPQMLQIFVQRENAHSVERESESFRVPAGSFREPSGGSVAVGSTGCFGSGRKKELLISEADEESKELQFSRRFAHRIVVADVMCQHRWSDIKHSDLLFLSSQMITTDSGRMGFTDVNSTQDLGKSRRPTEAKTLGGSSGQIGQKRSMSEIIGFNRFQSRSRNNNTLLPLTKHPRADEQKWFSISENTVESSISEHTVESLTSSNGKGEGTDH